MYKQTNSANNGARETKFAPFNNGDDGEHNGVHLVKTSKVFATFGQFLSLETRRFDRLEAGEATYMNYMIFGV